MPDKSDPQHLYSPEDFDFHLKPGSAAIDAGVLIPTINDDFTGRAPDLGAEPVDVSASLGRAPDLGAYEFDRALPHYGPRSQPSGAPDRSAPRSVTGPRS